MRFTDLHKLMFYRCMLPNFVTLESVFGGGLVARFHLISPAVALTLLPGVKLPPISPARTVVSRLTSRTRALLPTLTFVARWPRQPNTMIPKRSAQATAHHSSPTTPAPSRMRTGNSRVSRFINLLKFYVFLMSKSRRR